MLINLFYVLTCLMAVYGLVTLILSIISTMRQRTYPENNRIRVALLVKNQEEIIEGVIRSTFSEGLLKKTMSDGRLLVVDLNSTDETMAILTKLKDEYTDYMDVFGENQKDRIFKCFKEI